jgi:hypothetical protein
MEDAAKESAKAAREIYYQQREDLSPYADIGEYALNRLVGTPAQTTTTGAGYVTTSGGGPDPIISSQSLKTKTRYLNVLKKARDNWALVGDTKKVSNYDKKIRELENEIKASKTTRYTPKTSTKTTAGQPGLMDQYPEGEPFPEFTPPNVVYGQKWLNALAQPTEYDPETGEAITPQDMVEIQPGQWVPKGTVYYGTSPEDYEASPYRNYLLQESTEALERQAAARGYRRSPRLMEELQQNAMGIASADYSSWLDRQYREGSQNLGDFYNRAGFAQSQWGTKKATETGDWMNRYNALLNLAQLGQSAAAGQAIAGGQLSNQLGNLNMEAGQATGQGYLNQASALSQALASGANNYLFYNALNQNPQQTQLTGLGTGIYGTKGLDSRYLGYQGYGM